jgi:glycosyltransferase involved in cell wall biosynthesis
MSTQNNPNRESNKNIWIVMPAYNAAATVKQTFDDIPDVLKGQVILVDDGSKDDTVQIARSLGIEVIVHEKNRGYGGNQKTCYRAALNHGADVVIMLHPDYQYDSRVSLIMAELIQFDICDMVLGNRIRTRREALTGGMPKWKYFINRLSTFMENFILGQSIGDFHSGFRAYSRELLETIPFEANSEDFAFDQQFLVQAVAYGFRMGDVPVPVRYMDEASSINFSRSVRYGVGGLGAIGTYFLCKFGLYRDAKFKDATKIRKARLS